MKRKNTDWFTSQRSAGKHRGTWPAPPHPTWTLLQPWHMPSWQCHTPVFWYWFCFYQTRQQLRGPPPPESNLSKGFFSCATQLSLRSARNSAAVCYEEKLGLLDGATSLATTEQRFRCSRFSLMMFPWLHPWLSAPGVILHLISGEAISSKLVVKFIVSDCGPRPSQSAFTRKKTDLLQFFFLMHKGACCAIKVY